MWTQSIKHSYNLYNKSIYEVESNTQKKKQLLKIQKEIRFHSRTYYGWEIKHLENLPGVFGWGFWVFIDISFWQPYLVFLFFFYFAKAVLTSENMQE